VNKVNTYNWRKNFTASYLNHEKIICGKLAFKTKELDWLDTPEPVIILVSIHSKFHEEVGGNLKMNALLSTIKSHVKGQITVLISEMAHLQTLSLNYQGNVKLAFEECLEEAQNIDCRYQSYFENCKVVYWHSYINKDSHFPFSLDIIRNAYEKNQMFRELVNQDAKGTYTTERKKKYPNEVIFIEKAVEDILEQCASLLVLVNKGYAFQFYPGRPYPSAEYTSRVLVPGERRISCINVFLAIEKKTITPVNQD
jgi:hypothetical protein